MSQIRSDPHYSIELYPMLREGRWGLMNRSGDIVIPPRFPGCTPFFGGLARFAEQVGSQFKHGFIDSTGQVVIEPRFDAVFDFSEGLARVVLDDKWGFVDNRGEMVIATEFDDAKSFSEGLAPIQKEGQWGFIDAHGKMIIQPAYQGAWGFSEGLAAICVSGKWGFVDKTGAVVIPPTFTNALPFSQGFACVCGERTQRFTDRTGTVPDWRFIDGSGRLLTGRFDHFDLGSRFSEDLAWVGYVPGLAQGQLDPDYHCIDLKADAAFSLTVYRARPFFEGLAAAASHESGRWGFLNKSGEWEIQPHFDGVLDIHGREGFRGGLAPVKIQGQYGYVNRAGSFVWKES